jgi:hypothetical protein
MTKFNMDFIDPFAYDITIRRDTFDGITMFQATVEGFPDLAEYANSPEEAYYLAADALDVLYRASKEEGWDFPSAIDSRVIRRGEI